MVGDVSDDVSSPRPAGRRGMEHRRCARMDGTRVYSPRVPPLPPAQLRALQKSKPVLFQLWLQSGEHLNQYFGITSPPEPAPPSSLPPVQACRAHSAMDSPGAHAVIQSSPQTGHSATERPTPVASPCPPPPLMPAPPTAAPRPPPTRHATPAPPVPPMPVNVTVGQTWGSMSPA